MELQAIVMAAGRGNHMTDLTNSIPKPLLPVGNKPMIYYPVSMLEKAGFQEVIIVTLNSIKSSIEHAMKDFKISVTVCGISDDSDFDTVDSLRHVKDLVKSDMLIISCDVITQLPLHRLVDAHRLYDSSVTMLLSPSRPAGEAGPGMKVKKKGQHDQREFIGLCTTEQCYHRVLFLFNEADLEEDSLTVRQSLLCDFPRIQVRDELKDAHVYIVKRWIVDYIAHNKSRSSFRSELLPYIVQKQFDRHHKVEPGSLEKSPESAVGVHDTSLNVKDIFTFIKQDEETNIIRDLTLSSHTGADNPISCFAFIYEDGPLVNANNIASYVEANRLVSKAESGFCPEQSLIHPSSKLHEKSQAGSDSMIGERTSVDEQSIIKRSVIGKDCQIGSSVRISNCILMDRVKVGNGCNLQGSVIADRAIIEEKCEIADSLIGSNKVVTSSSKLNRESIVESSTMMEFD